MTKKIKKKKESLVLQISNRLRQDILEGVYKPKEKIIEEDITKRFNISRSPVRESFRVLEAENLINIIPGKGAFVTNIEEEDIDRIYEIRIVLEGLAAKLACRNITDEELARLLKINDAMEKSVREKDYQSFFKFNKEFHEFIYKITDNNFLVKMCTELASLSVRYRFYQFVFSDRISVSHENHKTIVEAFREKDEKKAEILRRKHMELSAKILREMASRKFFQ